MGAAAYPRGHAHLLQRSKHIFDHDLRPQTDPARNKRARRPGGKRRFNEVMAIALVRQGNEQIARLQAARVDRHRTGHREGICRSAARHERNV